MYRIFAHATKSVDVSITDEGQIALIMPKEFSKVVLDERKPLKPCEFWGADHIFERADEEAEEDIVWIVQHLYY